MIDRGQHRGRKRNRGGEKEREGERGQKTIIIQPLKEIMDFISLQENKE